MNQAAIEKLVGYKRSKPHKFGALRVTCRLGHSHPSKAEAKHCWVLQAQLESNIIKDLEYEKSYDLKCSGKLICVHRPDFTFKQRVFNKEITGPRSCTQTSHWVTHVDEVKGVKTPDWIIKSKLFQAQYPEIVYRVVD